MITILANRELAKTGGKIESLYSWSPPFSRVEKRSGDERELIEAVCRQEGLRCVYYNPDESLDQPVREVPEVQVMEEITKRELSHMSSDGIKFVLSGWGGDDAVSLRAGTVSDFAAGLRRLFY